MQSQKSTIEYRYYEIPQKAYVLPLLGDNWIIHHTTGCDEDHFHNHLEVGYCYYSTGEICFGDETYSLKPDSLCLIPAYHIHNTSCAYNTKSRWEYLYINVHSFLESVYPNSPDFVLKLTGAINNRALYLHKKENRALAVLMHKIIEEYRNKEGHYHEVIRGLLLSFLLLIARKQDKSVLKPENEFLEDEKKNHIKNAIQYIAQHYADPIRISELAKICFMSEPTFRRTFIRVMGLSPLSYIHLIRIEMACNMLRTTDIPIKDIALRNGFSTPSAFNRSFKAATGIAPYQWRKGTSNYKRNLNKQNVITTAGLL